MFLKFIRAPLLLLSIFSFYGVALQTQKALAQEIKAAPTVPSKPNSGKVETKKFMSIENKFEYTNFPLRIKLYEASKPDRVNVGKSDAVKKFSKAPLANEIKDGVIRVASGEFKKFYMVVENTSNEDQYFFVSPHEATPVELTLGFKYLCLCYNHAFRVPAKETWFRGVSISLKDFAWGDRIHVAHKVIGINKSKYEATHR